MSDTPSESSPPVDLTDLRLMPQWVADFGKQQPLRTFSDTDTDERPRRGRPDGRGDARGNTGFRPDRRGPGGGAGGGGGGFRPRPDGGGGRPPAGGGGRGPQGDRRREGRDSRGRGGDRFHERDREQAPRQEPPPQLVGLTVTIEPDHRAVEAMTQMIRASAKAFSVFDAAKLVLTSGDRFAVKFSLAPGATSRLHTVPADGSLWLSRDEAVAHLLQSDVLQQCYKVEDIELEEPKGNFTSVAICGMSGEMLGPPNHHSYQTALHRVHRERFANISFEDYKRRVRTESTPEAVEKWKESQKHGTQWIDLKAEVPEGGEAPRFKTRVEMETHFRNHYAAALIGEATEATVAGNIPRKHLAAGLFNVLRHTVEEARKHLLPLAQRLCSSFEQHGLKLFKRRGGKLWVSRTRPRLLDSHIALSERIAKIMGLIKDKPGIPVKELLAILAPHLEAEKATKAAAAIVPAAEVVSVKPSDSAESADTTVPATAEAAAPENAAAEAAAVTPAEEHDRVEALKDLHWLNSEGYIIEYSDGVVFPGVTEPPPAKPKPVKETPAKVAATKPESETATTDAPVPVAETSASEPYSEVFEESEAEIMVKEEAPPEAAVDAIEETSAEAVEADTEALATSEASQPPAADESAPSEHARHQD